MHDDAIELRQPAGDPESLRKWIKPVRRLRRRVHRRDVRHRPAALGARPADRRGRWRHVGRRRIGVLDAPDRAGRNGPWAGLSDVGVRTDPSAPRDPDEDGALAPRPGGRARRAGVDPARVRGCDLPAFRVRAGDAAGSVRSRSEGDPVRPAGRAARTRAARRGRRGDAAHPADLRSGPRGPGRGGPARTEKWRLQSWPTTHGGGAARASRTTRCSRSAASRAATPSTGTRATGTNVARRASSRSSR